MKRFAYVLALAITLASSPLCAEMAEEFDLTETIRIINAHKKDVLEQSMEFTKKESEAFWPLYEEFQKALTGIIEKTSAFVRQVAKKHNDLSEEEANTMIAEFLAIETKKLELKKTYASKFKKVIPSKKVMRYFQLENKMGAGFYHEIASNLPLVK